MELAINVLKQRIKVLTPSFMMEKNILKKQQISLEITQLNKAITKLSN